MHGRFAEKADSHITVLEDITYVLLIRHLASSVSTPDDSFRDSVLSVSQHEPRRIFVGLDSNGALGEDDLRHFYEIGRVAKHARRALRAAMWHTSTGCRLNSCRWTQLAGNL